MNTDKEKLLSIIDMFLNCKIPHKYIIFVYNIYNKEIFRKVIEKELLNTAFDFHKINNRHLYVIQNLKNNAIINIKVLNDSFKGHRCLFGRTRIIKNFRIYGNSL